MEELLPVVKQHQKDAGKHNKHLIKLFFYVYLCLIGSDFQKSNIIHVASILFSVYKLQNMIIM